MIVAVDTRWEATSYASDKFPLAPWRDQLPGSLAPPRTNRRQSERIIVGL